MGVSEAPRGTLFHDYTVDRNGLLQNGQHDHRHRPEQPGDEPHGGPDRPALHQGANEIPEGVLNRVEHGIRAYDPCLSCSTHAVGKMPLHVQIVDKDGSIRAEARRD